MSSTALPKTNVIREDAETKCCHRFDAKPWDEKEFVFKDKPFVKVQTRSFFHIPLNVGSVFTRTLKQIEKQQALSDEFALLTCDPSPWRSDHLFAVSKDVPGAEMVRLSGTFMTKVFEGPYRDTPKWMKAMETYVAAKGRTGKKTYVYYTTCPKCAKHYGKNPAVLFTQV